MIQALNVVLLKMPIKIVVTCLALLRMSNLLKGGSVHLR